MRFSHWGPRHQCGWAGFERQHLFKKRLNAGQPNVWPLILSKHLQYPKNIHPTRHFELFVPSPVPLLPPCLCETQAFIHISLHCVLCLCDLYSLCRSSDPVLKRNNYCCILHPKQTVGSKCVCMDPCCAAPGFV